MHLHNKYHHYKVVLLIQHMILYLVNDLLHWVFCLGVVNDKTIVHVEDSG